MDLFQKMGEVVKSSRDTWFGKVRGLFERPVVEGGVWDELEELLISADVGIDTAAKLIERVRRRAREERLDGQQVYSALKQEMVNMLRVDASSVSLPGGIAVILVAGVNGSGKTTSIAKLAYSLGGEGRRVILAAADTFRAAAIDQLKHWGERVGAEVVAHQPGGDPGAVVYDAIQAARSRHAQVVIIDTAGRLHTRFNLMEELRKIKRVAAPHEVLLVLDATTGQNGLVQASHFTEAIEVTGIFLAKLDGTAKGGIVLAICDQLKIPILFVGTGEGLEDMIPFDAEAFVGALCS